MFDGHQMFANINLNSPGPSEREGPWPVPFGRPTNATDSVSLAREWQYNSRSELAEATIGTNAYVYAYDTIGNREYAALNGVTNTYAANALNQYTTIPRPSGPPRSPLYDADGNLVNDRTLTYTYDAENRLVSATQAALTNGALRVLNAYDHNGNIVWYVSEFGAVAAEYVYDPYGNVVETTGALAEQFSFGFSTKPLDHETGLVAYQRRFLRPAIGRWLNRDPIEEEGGENLYAFCINAPTILFDVEGMWFRELSNFCAGVGDSLTFGITRLLRHGINRIIEGTWDDPADVDSNAYLAGEITEVTVEIAVTVGGATLRHTAKATSRAAVEAGARKTYRRHHKIVGGFVHHINPIKGHMNGKPARFPLPYEWAARGEWNMTWYATKAEHTAAHKSMMMLEAVDRFRTVTLGARQGANIIMTQLNSSEDTRCWDSIDVSIGVSQEDIGGSVLNTVPDTIAIQFQESGRSW